MNALGDVLETINGWQLLGLIIALGAVTMALLQLITDLTPLRSIFNAIQLRRWIAKRFMEYDRQGKKKRGIPAQAAVAAAASAYVVPWPKVDADEAFSQLVAHATGGHSGPFLSLRPSQLVAQVNAAAQAALENPASNFSLLAILSQSAEPYIPLILPAQQPQAQQQPQTQQSPASAADQPPSGVSSVPDHFDDLGCVLKYPRTGAPAAASPETQRYVDARARLAYRIQRNLDGMQITLGNDTAWFNQVFSIIIGTVIAYFVVTTERTATPIPLAWAFALGVSAGYAAPIFGDIVAALRRLGRT
jgi:hypothetical protein